MMACVEVDIEQCCGNGMYAALAPGVCEMDDRGKLTVLRSDVPDNEVDELEQARLCCPVSAVTL
jgi:ferredoxin